MPILVLLILLDVVVLGIVMYFVLNEKPKQHGTAHPYVTEARQNEEKARAAQQEAARNAAEKTE